MARKKRLKIALIGYGAISQTLFDVFAEKKPAIDVVGVDRIHSWVFVIQNDEDRFHRLENRLFAVNSTPL